MLRSLSTDTITHTTNQPDKETTSKPTLLYNSNNNNSNNNNSNNNNSNNNDNNNNNNSNHINTYSKDKYEDIVNYNVSRN